MSLWYIALPCVFGCIILGSILACCLCPCSPEKAVQRENENVAQVLEVVLYPEDGRREAQQAGDGSAAVHVPRSTNEPHPNNRYYYPLQAGEQRPVTAAVAGSAATRAAEPFVGTVVAGADAADGRSGDASVRPVRRALHPIDYGEAAYVPPADTSNSPMSQDIKNGNY